MKHTMLLDYFILNHRTEYIVNHHIKNWNKILKANKREKFDTKLEKSFAFSNENGHSIKSK